MREMADRLGPDYRIADWKELNKSLFSALTLEKIAMFMVLAIIIVVASFSIVGNLVMVVVEKQRQIAVLKTLGATDRDVMSVFALQGLTIGVVGSALGVATGLVACAAAIHFGLPLDENVYYLDRLPLDVQPLPVLATAIAGIVVSFGATFYPATLAARVRAADGMR
jgi:lipoprotein-releasing system permease protein